MNRNMTKLNLVILTSIFMSAGLPESVAAKDYVKSGLSEEWQWNYEIVRYMYGAPYEESTEAAGFHFDGRMEDAGNDYDVFVDGAGRKVAGLRSEDGKVYLNTSQLTDMYSFDIHGTDEPEVLLYDFTCGVGDRFMTVGFDDRATWHGRVMDGPYHFPEKLIPLMIANALNDRALPVYGKGENVRDWLYVEDHCIAIDMILRKGTAGEVYNIGGHNERTNLQVVKTVIAALGKSEDLITYVTDRPGHDRRYAIDPTKIHDELGWEPYTKFDEGIQKTIQWYLDNRGWWENIISGEYQNYYEKMYGDR